MGYSGGLFAYLRFLKILAFVLSFFTLGSASLASGTILPQDEASIELRKDWDTARTLAIEHGEETAEDSSCSLDIIILSSQFFSNEGGSRDFCRSLGDYCLVRRFGSSWESAFRFRQSFRGHGYDKSEARRKVLDSYARFQRGNHRLFGEGFQHLLRFRSCG